MKILTTPIHVTGAFVAALVLAGCGGSSAKTQHAMTPDQPPVAVPEPTGTLSTALVRTFDPLAVALDTDSGIKSIAISDDGSINVVYIIDGTDHAVSFSNQDHVPERLLYRKAGNPGFFLWERRGSFTDTSEFDHMKFAGWTTCVHPSAADACSPADDKVGELVVDRGFVVWGDPSPSLSMGSAEYQGIFHADSWPVDSPSSRSQSRLRGDLSLSVDFDAGSITGMIDDMEVRAPGESEYAAMVATISFAGTTSADSGIRATLSGTGVAADIAGTVNGGFYGPSAEEVGGMIDGTFRNEVFVGFFAGEKAEDE
jgi:hypothetical protein